MEAVGLLMASEEEKRQCYKDNVGRMELSIFRQGLH